MPFQFVCPHCGAETVVDDQYAGQSGNCFSCAKAIQLPSNTESFAHVASELISSEQTYGRKRFLTSTIVGLLTTLLVAGTIYIVVTAVGYRIGLLTNPEISKSKSNLQTIMLAMQSYHDTFGSYPPAYIADANGKKLHSWRVLILPYMNQKALYDQYRFDEPWDGPNNSMLEQMMPQEFASPMGKFAYTAETSYMVVVGNGTAFPGAGTTSLSSIADGPANTIMVAEVAPNGTSWLEPVDLDVNKMTWQINGGRGTEMGGHENGTVVATADAQTHFLPERTVALVLQGLTTINGGENLAISDHAVDQ